jgi:hypothetical protein
MNALAVVLGAIGAWAMVLLFVRALCIAAREGDFQSRRSYETRRREQ